MTCMGSSGSKQVLKQHLHRGLRRLWDWQRKCMQYFCKATEGAHAAGVMLSRRVTPCAWAPAQVESALAVQKLRPSIDAIKRQYGDDRKSIQRETSALYEASGVSPTAGRVTIVLLPFMRGLHAGRSIAHCALQVSAASCASRTLFQN